MLLLLGSVIARLVLFSLICERYTKNLYYNYKKFEYIARNCETGIQNLYIINEETGSEVKKIDIFKKILKAAEG
jgi:hypothetical protein